jgi:CcmD family protein
MQEMSRRLLVIAVLVAVAGTLVFGAQPQGTQPAPDGFERVSALPQAEQLPAAPLVIAAYASVWVALMAYVWMLWRRLGRVERELADLTRRVQER